MKIMFSAGEASGDMHGANLARALKEQDPEVELLGMGGSRMAEAGVRIVYDIGRNYPQDSLFLPPAGLSSRNDEERKARCTSLYRLSRI